MKLLIMLLSIICLSSCSTTKYFRLRVPENAGYRMTGNEFYKSVISFGWAARDSVAVREILSGNMPAFLGKFVAVRSQIRDSTGKIHRAVLYVSPDYLSVGTNNGWARIPLTPMAAQKIADSFHCFLPTKKIVDLIYQHATVKLEPVPMYAFRDSSVTMWQHHLIIEGQRQGRKGLIAGIKKDLVLSGKMLSDSRPNREAIYGWHQLNGIPIQPLYTGHINWWVDYSHGTRLVYRKIKVDGKEMDYIDILEDPVLQKLICDETACNFYRYNY
ncbi:hypothetical protein BH11BAC3_BH11BAC3_46330 [soil metagenome]